MTQESATITKEEIDFLIQSNLIEGVGEDGLDDSIKAWSYARCLKRITKDDVLEIHRLLMQRLNPRIAGKFRECSVRVGGSRCPDPDTVMKRIDYIIDEFNIKPCFSKAPLIKKETLEKLVKDDHVDFEHLHPFEDGNGRVGRILMNWQRLYLGLDIQVIEYKDRWEYYGWF